MPPRGASAKRYAQAVFELAAANQSFDKWQDDLDSLAIAAANPGFVALVENARLSNEQKRLVVQQTLSGIGSHALNLATVLVLKGRLAALAKPISEQFRALVDEHRGLVRAEVVTAVDLDDARVRQMSDNLSRVTGKQVQVARRVDPAIVGGMVVRVGDRVLDGSVRTRLRALRRSLAE